MTQADWVKEYRKKFTKEECYGGPGGSANFTKMKTDDEYNDEVGHDEFEGSCLDIDLEDFISKVESLAQQRTEKKIILGLEELANSKLGKSVYQDGIRQGIRESQKYISDLNN